MARLFRSGLIIIVLCVGAVAAGAQSHEPSTVPPALVKLLQEIKASDTDLLAVSEEDGRFLRVMVASSGAMRALEIGGAHGYSAIWIGLGLRQTGGKLTTIEYDPARAKIASADPPPRSFPRTQRGEQAERDAGFSRRHSKQPGADDDNRPPLWRGDVGVGETSVRSKNEGSDETPSPKGEGFSVD
jgi:hypothetical protein